MTFLQLYLTLRRHRKLSERRDPMFEANKAAKWSVYVSMTIMVLYLLIFAILFAIDANDSRRYTTIEYLMGISPFIILIDFWLRFIAQQTPSQIIKPYVLLPIPRYICIDSFILNSLFGFGNLLWFIMLVPYCLMAVVFSYGLLPTLSFLILWYIIILANSQWYAICRTLIIHHLLWWLLPVTASLLLFVPWLIGDLHTFYKSYAHIGSNIEHGNILPHFIALAILAAMLIINRRLQYISVWKELGKQEVTHLKSVSKFGFLDRLGEIGEYIRLDIKSLIRNKNPRKSIIFSTLLVVVLSIVISFTEVYDNPLMTNFWCIYNFAIYGAMILVRTMSFEGNYIDALMVRKEYILQLLTAKYYLFCMLLLLPFVLMLPMVIVGKWNIMMLLSYGTFTAGFQYCMLMQMAVYNKQKLPLNEKFIKKGGIDNNYIGVLVELGAFFLPLLVISILEAFFDHFIAWMVMLLIGVGFIATHKLWLRNIYQRIMLRKYEKLEAFHS